MGKYIKIIILILVLFFVLFLIDFVSIYTRNKPIFAISGSSPYMYSGLLYDTYNCPEYSIAQIKMKGSKFACSEMIINSNLIYGIITEINDNYIVIKGTRTTSNLSVDDFAHISLSNNPNIVGADVLMLGQEIEIKPTSVQEIYPIRVVTDEIIIKN